jgi:hypothetical protein
MHPKLYTIPNWTVAALKNDKEIVMAAVAENGGALQYASAALKNDKEIWKAAPAPQRTGLVGFSPRVTHGLTILTGHLPPMSSEEDENLSRFLRSRAP